MKLLLNRLTETLMNERQAKVFLALLSAEGSTATELHRLSGVGIKKIYNVLTELCNKSFVYKVISNSKIQYYVSNPENFFEPYFDQKKEEIVELESLKDDILELYNTRKKNEGFEDYIEIVYGKMNVHKRFVKILKSSSRLVYSISCPPYAIVERKQSEEQAEALKGFQDKGGFDKAIHELNESSPPFVFDSVRVSLEHPDLCELRITPKSPIKLFIFDDELMMTFNKTFILEGQDLCTSIIKDPNTVETYRFMFEYLWNQSQTFDEWIKENKELYECKLREFDEN